MFAILTALIIAAQASGAQSPAAAAIVGRVVDEKGSALAGVAVSLGGQPLKAPQTVKTDSGGDYRFADIPFGHYTLSFRLAGYAPVNASMILVNEIPPIDVSGAKPRPMTYTMVTAGPPQPIRFTTRSGAGSALSGLVQVRIETSFGNIDMVVDTNRAPITAANFLKYVDAGLYDGGRFNRVTRPDNYNTAPPNRPMMEIIQGGINPEKKGQGFPAIPLERTSVTGINHVRGVVSMARGGPDSATSEFFILLDDQPSLDFGGKRFDDAQGAAAFGVVIAGLDVVARIQQQPVQAQNLSPPVPIISAKRIK